jgi:hypothetical protein
MTDLVLLLGLILLNLVAGLLSLAGIPSIVPTGGSREVCDDTASSIAVRDAPLASMAASIAVARARHQHRDA